MKSVARWMVLGVSACLLIAGCGKSESGSSSDSAQSSTVKPDAKANQSSPKGTMILFMRAIKGGDADLSQKLVIGNDKQKAFVVSLVKATSAIDQVHSVAKSKLGVELTDLGFKTFGTDAGAEDKIMAAKEVINGDQATVESGTNEPPAEFKKEDGKWRMVLTEAIVPTKSDFPVRMLDIATDASNKVAAGIRDGKYKTKEEAENAFNEEMKAIFAPAKKPGAESPQ